MRAPTLGAVPPIRFASRGCRHDKLLADEAFDHSRFRRLAVRHERRADTHLAFTTLSGALVGLNQIRRFRERL